MGSRHGYRAPAPGVHRDAGCGERRIKECDREAMPPARPDTTEGPGFAVPIDGGATGYTSTRAPARRNVGTTRRCGWPAAAPTGGANVPPGWGSRGRVSRGSTVDGNGEAWPLCCIWTSWRHSFPVTLLDAPLATPGVP